MWWTAGKKLLSRFLCPLSEKCGTFIARCNALIEKVSTCVRDDEATSGIPRRVGRQKVVMFSSGRTFLAECAAAVETADGVEVRWFGIRSCTSAPSLTLTSDGRGKSGPQDVAVLSLGAEVAVAGLPTQLEDTEGSAGPSAAGSALAAPEHLEPGALPAAEVADQAVELGGRLFCVGNPSNVDLESLGGGEIGPAAQARPSVRFLISHSTGSL
eukprot:SAG31_NODE_2446_length_5678_cov_9.411185_8_plen_213_part_00